MTRFSPNAPLPGSAGAYEAPSSPWRPCPANAGSAPVNQPTIGDIARGQMGWLLGTIEGEIIPRLIDAHRASGTARAAAASVSPELTSQWVGELARIILANRSGVAASFVQELLSQGVALDVVYLDVLSPTARHLGAMWEQDLCDFTDVTIGLWRLQQLMYEFSPTFQREAAGSRSARRVMLVPVPGSQHTLGLLMVAEFFRRAGWTVWGDPTASQRDLVAAARSEWFDVIGFSVGTEDQLTALTGVIPAIRQASLNASLGVMVGGPLLVAHPEYAQRVHADATASDAAQAVVEAEHLLARAAARPQA